MANLANTDSLVGKYFSTMEWKVVSQALINNLKISGDIDEVYESRKSINGVVQDIYMGTLDVVDLKKKITSIDDFKAPQPDYKDTYIIVDNEKAVKITMSQLKAFMTAFSTEATKESFVKGMIETLFSSLKIHMVNYKLYTLIAGKIKGKLKGKTNSQSIVWDADIVLNDFSDDTKVKQALEKMREQLIKFQTISKQHTAFSRDADNKNYFAEFMPKDFNLVWNAKYWNKIGTTTATLFNKDDILLTGPNQIQKYFNIVESLDAGEKTASDDVVAFLVHKKALPILSFQEEPEINEVNLPNFTRYKEIAYSYGVGRLKVFPIVRFKTK